ncbi:MAG: glutamine-hydrolyzing GMP synthase [Oscillospiraceae bacterium]|jgi:GMP synthase (glutamine-hydrolysing)|nr:glutamine-hydrolyzing GMP synthase [Oscillospiraceae bacterium]
MSKINRDEFILVLDFGGQYKELIARAVRGLSVYSEIKPGDLSLDEIKGMNPAGIILTGGPKSVYLPGSPVCDPGLFSLGVPVLGICYGMHLMCHMLGGKVESGGAGEYGRVVVNADSPFTALMSHRDIVTRLPEGFVATARTASCIASCENAKRKLYAVQYHPESAHTEGGKEIIRRFLYGVCGVSGNYKIDDYVKSQTAEIRQKLGKNGVLLALSGGVDSSVCAGLLSKAVPNQLVCIFVDHGLMRLNEGDEIQRVFSGQKLRFIRVNAKERFLVKLKGVVEPEAKRKIIGEEFIRVFEEESARLGRIPFLAQGTIYPDIVESGGKYGSTIKSHHNVGGLPERLSFDGVIEPLSGLFKDEVRVIGKKLGLPSSLVNRQPFPGPGLAVRVMGAVTEEKLDILRKADAILREELDGVKRRPNQYFAVLTDTKSVGVKGDERTYNPVIAVRAVETDDFMTCEYARLSHKVLGRISSRITSEISGVSRVVYDITGKPPGTVEWE